MLAGAAACATLGLAACGSAVAGQGTHAVARHSAQGSRAAPAAAGRAAAVCGPAAGLDRVVITHIPSPMTSYMHQFLPLGVLVTKPSAVRGLAATLCGLPRASVGAMCPNDTGALYRLAFATRSHALPPVTMRATGCRTVTGLGPVRTWARTPRAWTALREALASGHGLIPEKLHGTAHS
jgi:hypothetical protein